ncbi:cytochrome c oxidase assembly protein COX18, mitochondrial [Parasteatoda tepidariorum]|nr:cytochrome c oxidase assembly protein COX18, mitochondrial [Parasteatoda tepidariorum]
MSILNHSVKRIICCKRLHYKAFNYQFPGNHQFKISYCLASCSFLTTRHFSWTGFYSALSQSTPVLSFQNLLLEVHEITSLPWWAVIMLTTLGIRSIIVFPLSVHQNQVMARLMNINAGLGAKATQLNEEVNIARRMYNWNEEQAKKVFRRQMKKIYQDSVIRDNCHPFKATLLVLIQVPVWICFSVSLRNLTMASSMFNSGFDSLYASFKTEGVLWFPDLTCPDPIFIPLLLLLVNGSLIEIHAMRQIGKGSLFQKVMLNSSRLITIIVALAASINPSSVTFYWLCSSSIGLCQNVLLMAPRVRSILNIPKTGHESATPFLDLAANLRKRFKI